MQIILQCKPVTISLVTHWYNHTNDKLQPQKMPNMQGKKT